jgi:hypothetical protein
LNNKYKKKKEDIRTEILKKVEVFHRTKGIIFFDNSIPNLNEFYTIDDNDLEVLLVTINKSNRILLTTKCLFINHKSTTTRVDGKEIEDFDLMAFVNSGSKQSESIFKKMYNKYQLMRHIGDFRITKKDGSFIEVYLPKRNFVYCLSGTIMKLQFVTEKYEGI